MQNQNCPRCNMFLAPGAQVCPNCQLNLLQYSFQQQAPHHQMPAVGLESKQEKNYRKLLVIIAILVMSEVVTYRIPDLLDDWFHFDLYSLMKPINWLVTIAWAGLPLVIGILLPKNNSIRVLLIVFASIYGIWHLGNFVYYEWIYSYDSYDYSNY